MKLPYLFPSVVPLIADVLDAISEGKIFSKMDMTQGFLQLKLAEESMHKTAFSCYKGVFEYYVGALGMTNVPAYFLFAVSNVFADLRKIVNTFFDDFIGHTKGKNQKEALGGHITDTRIILQRCKDNNIFLNFVKSVFFQPSIEVLGYRVSENKQMLPLALSGKLDALLPPKSSKDIQCFLGLVGFYRTYIKGFATIAAPLIAAQTTKPFVWTSECQSAFLKLRSIASEEPYLRSPVRPGHVNYTDPISGHHRRFRCSDRSCFIPKSMVWRRDWVRGGHGSSMRIPVETSIRSATEL